MTSTSTLRTGFTRFVNHLAALALLLVVAGGASAQSTIFVDSNGGDDGNNGQSATIGAGVNGPVRTIDRALQIARNDAAGNTISLEAGEYDADLTVANAGSATNLNTLTFLARPDQAGNTEVELDLNGGTFQTETSGFTFARQGAGTFSFIGDGTVDFQSGSVAFGSGIVSFDDVSVVERTNATTTGTVVYGSVPDVIRFNGDAGTSQGTLLPASLDIADGTLLIDVALGSVASTVNDNARTFTLGTTGLTLGDDGGQITLQIRDGNTVAGTITTVDGNGTEADGNNVTIDGEGSIGTLIVAGARTIFSLQEDDVDGDSDNQAGTVLVQSGQFVLPDEDGDIERYTVGGDFIQSGGRVLTEDGLDQDNEDTILVVKGNFRRTSNVAGNFAPINLYLEGTMDAEFAPGTNLTLNSLHINETDGTAASVKTVTFLQDITVTSDATGTNAQGNIIPFIVTNDAEVDLNGNLVNITNGGESIVDGTVSDSDNSGAVRFTNSGVASGTGVYSSILVSGPSITAEDEFEFTGALILLDGGINISGDVSPIGPNASVIVNIAATNDPQITGSFNGDEVEYDLVYQDSEATAGDSDTNGTFVAGTEFDTDFVRDLTVDVTNATVDASGVEDGMISGDVIVRNGNIGSTTGTVETATLEFDDQDIVVMGSTTIEDNAILDLGDGATYAVSTANNVLDGTITSDDDDGLLILRDGSTITGTQTTRTAEDGSTARAAQSESTIEANIRLNNDASASLLQIREIEGDIFDQATGSGDAGTLTLGLIADDEDIDDERFNKNRSGNVDGTVTLDFSTLALASDVQFTEDDGTITISTLNTNTFTFFTEAEGTGDNDDGPSALVLRNDVIGTGAVWPSSDLTISKIGTAPQTLVIPVFHPGDDEEDDITVASNIRVTNVLRITGNLDAETADDQGDNNPDYAVTLEGIDGSVPTLILDEDYSIANDGGNEPENSTDRELVINGPINLTINESEDVDDYTQLVLATQNVQALTVNNEAMLNDENETYTVASFVTSAATADPDGDFNTPNDEPGRLDLNSNSLSVLGDVTLGSDGAVFNTAAGNDDRVSTTGVANSDYSTFSFIGANDATLSVTPNANTGVTTFGDGVDLRLAKDSTTTEVTLVGGSLVFDDDFDGAADDDETFILERGTFVAGDSDDPNGTYIRLDHNNSLGGSISSDFGQGFVFVPANTQFPEAYIEGNVRKRIFSDPTVFGGDTTPGRVVYPVGSSDGSGEGYAEFVLDFESIAQDQSFGVRSVTVSFINESPSGELGLPITRADGVTTIDETGLFYWLVTSNPSLGQSTRFNVEARYDGFELVTATTNDGTPTLVSDLTLIRRQFGDEMTNPYTLVSETYDSFLLQDPDNASDNEPVVIAADAQAFLGPQGTIFTYGLDAGNRAVANGGDVPTAFALNGNRPNPFSTRTALSFDLPEAAEVSVEVYDVMGRRVVSIDKGAMTAGADQRVEIDGSGLASGVYVYRVNVVGASETWTRSGQITLTR